MPKSPPPRLEPDDPRHAEQTNRAFWDGDADDYQAAHGAALTAAAMAWGPFRIPETELQMLGDVTGCDVLEYGCGAAQWSVALAADPTVRVTGLDLSARQLDHAARNRDTAAVAVALVCASATATPFADCSFDVVFCDHGAMSFCDPTATVAEVARLLRPGGRLAFSVSSPLLWWTYDARRDRQTDRLRNAAFGRRSWHVEGGTVDYCVPVGEWLRLFAVHDLVAVDLVEPQVGADAFTTYAGYIDPELATRWPFEQMWKVVKIRR